MLTDGIDLVDGSSITNMTVASGTTLPSSPTPNDGELFYLTSGNIGLHVYDASTPGWVQVTTATGVNAGGSTADYFEAALSADYSYTPGVQGVIPFNVKLYDTQSAYDNTTNYRYTPTVAGVYRVRLYCLGNLSTSSSAGQIMIQKNGTSLTVAGALAPVSNNYYQTTSVEAYVTMNGTTDYLEAWVYGHVTGGVIQHWTGFYGTSYASFFSAQYVSA